MDGEPIDERRAAEWGLASLVLGAVLVLLGPPTLHLEHELDSRGFTTMTRTEIRLAAVGGGMAAMLLLSFAVAGVVFGFWAIGAARRAGLPPARGIAAVMLNGVAVFIWTSAGGAWIGSTWWRF